MVKGMLGAAQKVTGEMMLVVAWYREDGAVLDISHVEKKKYRTAGQDAKRASRTCTRPPSPRHFSRMTNTQSACSGRRLRAARVWRRGGRPAIHREGEFANKKNKKIKIKRVRTLDCCRGRGLFWEHSEIPAEDSFCGLVARHRNGRTSVCHRVGGT